MSFQSDKDKAISELVQWIKDKHPHLVTAETIPADKSYFDLLSYAKTQYNLSEVQTREYTFLALMKLGINQLLDY